MAKQDSPPAPKPQTVTIQVKYEDMTARYASQVLINATGEECYLDFSSGTISDKASGNSVMPIHTRIVMSPGGARRLHQFLGQALQNQEARREQARPASQAKPRP